MLRINEQLPLSGDPVREKNLPKSLLLPLPVGRNSSTSVEINVWTVAAVKSIDYQVVGI